VNTSYDCPFVQIEKEDQATTDSTDYTDSNNTQNSEPDHELHQLHEFKVKKPQDKDAILTQL